MIANLTRGAKTASLHLPADRFQIASVLSYLGIDRLDDYDIPCEGQDSSGIMVSLEPTGIAERNIAELCRSEKVSLGRLNSNFCSLFKLPYEQQLGVMDQIASQKPEHFDDFRKAIDTATVKVVSQQTWSQVVIPANGRNLVYFKWTVPADGAGTTYFCKGTITHENAEKEQNSDNNTTEYAVVATDYNSSQTPNTRFEKNAPAGYSPNATTPAAKAGGGNLEYVGI